MWWRPSAQRCSGSSAGGSQQPTWRGWYALLWLPQLPPCSEDPVPVSAG